MLNTDATIFDTTELFVVSPLRRTIQSMVLLLIGDIHGFQNDSQTNSTDTAKAIRKKLVFQPLCSERANEKCDMDDATR